MPVWRLIPFERVLNSIQKLCFNFILKGTADEYDDMFTSGLQFDRLLLNRRLNVGVLHTGFPKSAF